MQELWEEEKPFEINAPEDTNESQYYVYHLFEL